MYLSPNHGSKGTRGMLDLRGNCERSERAQCFVQALLRLHLARPLRSPLFSSEVHFRFQNASATRSLPQLTIFDVDMTDLQTEREAGNRKLIAIAVISTMTGVSALFVVARLFVRVRLMKTIGLDDYLLAFALVKPSS